MLLSLPPRAARVASLLAVASWMAGGRDELIRPGDLVVANIGNHTLAVLDGGTGELRGTIAAGDAELRNPTGVAFGPDGNLYVASSGNDRILRYDGATGEYRGVLASGARLTRPFSLIIGPDSPMVLVSSGSTVLRYSLDGRYLGVAASGMQQPIGLAIAADGLLYVASSTEGRVERFDPETGRPRGPLSREDIPFVSDVAFGPGGRLYASSASRHEVVRVDRSGAVSSVVRLPHDGVPMGLAFTDSVLLIGDFANGRIFSVDPDRPETLRLLADEGLFRPENFAVRPPR